MYKEKANQITDTLHNYFEGIYQGDVPRLKSSFADDVFLHGDIKGVPYFKNLEEYLAGVQGRKSPQELGEAFRMEVLSIEILGQVAIAKVHVPMLGFNYYDYLSLSKIGEEWKIVNKVFTHVA